VLREFVDVELVVVAFAHIAVSFRFPAARGSCADRASAGRRGLCPDNQMSLVYNPRRLQVKWP
jgi:hypothetical protein